MYSHSEQFADIHSLASLYYMRKYLFLVTLSAYGMCIRVSPNCVDIADLNFVMM